MDALLDVVLILPRSLSIRAQAGTNDATGVLESLGLALAYEKLDSHRDGEAIYRALVAFGNLVSGRR